jgi:hypothetical protein
MGILATSAALMALSFVALPVLGNPQGAAAMASQESVPDTTKSVEVNREYRDQYIDLGAVLATGELNGMEIVGVDVFGRRASARTLLTLWINDRVQNSEWMSEEAVTELTPHQGWIVGNNATSLQIYVSGSMGYVERVEIHFRGTPSR